LTNASTLFLELSRESRDSRRKRKRKKVTKNSEVEAGAVPDRERSIDHNDLIWVFLESWVRVYNLGLFQTMANKEEERFTGNTKLFLSNILSYSITNLNKRYNSLFKMSDTDHLNGKKRKKFFSRQIK
jgi:hypothetical protein